MVDMQTQYLGLTLKNPVIIGASNLVQDLGTVKKLEAAGAAAIVYKSLFEEQIQLESLKMHEDMHEYNERHAEMISLFPRLEHSGPKEHLLHLQQVKESVGIPVIASLNAIYHESWEEYAILLEKHGADALELNFYAVPDSMDKAGTDIEDYQVKVLDTIKKAVRIPVSVKLSPFYSNTLHLVKKMDEAGADGFVLFNRLFQPDIDLNSASYITPLHLSQETEDFKLPLRYSGLLSGNIRGGICQNTGIFSGNQVLKALLAGADCVQLVSAIYKHGISHLSVILSEIEKWMEAGGYQNITAFKGMLSRSRIKDPFIFKRAQYVDILLKSDEIFSRYPLR